MHRTSDEHAIAADARFAAAPDGPSRPRRIAAAAALAAWAATVVADLLTDPAINFAVAYSIPVVLCLWTGSRAFLWTLTAASAVVAVAIFVATSGALGDAAWYDAVNRAMAIGVLLLLAAKVHVHIGLRARDQAARAALARHAADLESANDELAAREEEIARQNEELQSQTEELERQSEELRVANEELVQRERTLESLLDLSRTLTLELSENETLERICELLGQLVDGRTVATAILLRDDSGMRVRCHVGFGPEGPDVEHLPFGRSFAELVMSQARTGYLHDLSLRPDIDIPQPKRGARMRSVLASPLIVRGRSLGTIEIYSTEQRTWNDEQIALIESLAAQTSISIENGQLYEQAEAERGRLRAVLDTAPVVIGICDETCRRVTFNRAGAALFGLPQDVTVDPGANGRWTSYRDGQPLTPDTHPLFRAVRSGEAIDAEEYELVFASGRRLTLLTSVAPIRDREGRIVGAVSASVDITDHKSLQRELDRRRREAEEASVRKSRFLAAASHDIRTPANAISLIAELIKRTADNPAMAAEVPQLALELQNSALSLVNLVNNVLDVGRFENGQVELHETEFPLHAVLEEEFRQLQPLANDKRLSYACDLPRPAVWVRTDRVKVGRIVGNLLGNAIKFTDAGSVRLSVTSSAEPSSDGQGLRIVIQDTGIGIAREHQQRIFDEFYQLSNPHRSKGTGLGLAISKRLAEAMGGSIHLESEPGKGSTFTVMLPASCVVPHPATGGGGGGA